MVLRIVLLLCISTFAIANETGPTYFAKASYITWNKHLILERDGDSDVELYSKERGACLGGGAQYSYKELNLISSLCVAPLTATISEAKETGVNFNQHNVHVNAFLFQNQIYWMPKEDTKIGFGIPLAYRTGEYGSLSEGDVKEYNQYDLGYEFSLKWKIDQYELGMSIGSLSSYESSYWIVGINYFFDSSVKASKISE